MKLIALLIAAFALCSCEPTLHQAAKNYEKECNRINNSQPLPQW